MSSELDVFVDFVKGLNWQCDLGWRNRNGLSGTYCFITKQVWMSLNLHCTMAIYEGILEVEPASGWETTFPTSGKSGFSLKLSRPDLFDRFEEELNRTVKKFMSRNRNGIKMEE